MRRVFPLFCSAFLALASCDSPTTSATTGVSLSVALAQSGSGAVSPVATRDLVLDDGQNTLTLTRVAIVIREVELKLASDSGCDSGEEHGDCDEFESGPYLLELPLDGELEQVLTIDVPPGTYEELEFEIHKAGNRSSEDSTFLAAHPEFSGVSIRVEGDFDGEAFVFEQRVSEEQEIHLSPPLVVEEGIAANVTLTIDVSTWFLNSDGSVIDPRTANHGGENADRVKDNIERSLEGFEDDDRDGECEGHEDDEDHHGGEGHR